MLFPSSPYLILPPAPATPFQRLSQRKPVRISLSLLFLSLSLSLSPVRPPGRPCIPSERDHFISCMRRNPANTRINRIWTKLRASLIMHSVWELPHFSVPPFPFLDGLAMLLSQVSFLCTFLFPSLLFSSLPFLYFFFYFVHCRYRRFWNFIANGSTSERFFFFLLLLNHAYNFSASSYYESRLGGIVFLAVNNKNCPIARLCLNFIVQSFFRVISGFLPGDWSVII